MKHRVIQLITQRIDRRFLVYAIAFAVVSSVPAWYVYHLVFHSAALVGADPANHIVFIKQIVESKNLLFPIAQFYPEDPGAGYYPPFPAVIIAGLHLITRAGIIEILKFFLFFAFIIGQLGYALLSIKLADNNLNKGLFIYLTLSFSMGLLLKTFRDGCYGEIFVFCFLLPLFLHCTLGYRLIWSALLFALIIASNIPATFGTSILVLAFLFLYLFNREWDKVKFILKVILITAVLASPVLYYTYFLMAMSTAGGALEPYSTSIPSFGYASLYVPLFASGSICTAVLLIFYRRQRWLGLWTALYLLIIFIPFLSGLWERFLREVSVPLALTIGIVLYDGIELAANKVSGFRPESLLGNAVSLRIVLLALVVIAVICTGIAPMASEANPVVRDHFTHLKLEAYQWLNEETAEQEVGVVIISTMDPWAKVYVNNWVWGVLSPLLSGRSLSAHDRATNDDLVLGLLHPSHIDNLLERNIGYLILSAPLPDRWCEPETKEFVDELMGTIGLEKESNYRLVYCRYTGEELIKIYKIEAGETLPSYSLG